MVKDLQIERWILNAEKREILGSRVEKDEKMKILEEKLSCEMARGYDSVNPHKNTFK